MNNYDHLKPNAHKYLVSKNWHPVKEYVAMMAEFAYLYGYKKKHIKGQMLSLIEVNKKLKDDYEYLNESYSTQAKELMITKNKIIALEEALDSISLICENT
jgi:hypothetical protein